VTEQWSVWLFVIQTVRAEEAGHGIGGHGDGATDGGKDAAEEFKQGPGLKERNGA
jgi:hypothetical protein